MLEYGDDPEVEQGETAVQAFIARAGRPEGEEADKETVTAFEEANHSVLMKLRDELLRFIGWIEFLPDRPSGAPRPHSLSVLKIAGRGVRARTPEEVSEQLTPVMTRLGPADLATVDTLITAPDPAEAELRMAMITDLTELRMRLRDAACPGPTGL